MGYFLAGDPMMGWGWTVVGLYFLTSSLKRGQ